MKKLYMLINIYNFLFLLILGVEPSLTVYKTVVRTDTLYELVLVFFRRDNFYFIVLFIYFIVLFILLFYCFGSTFPKSGFKFLAPPFLKVDLSFYLLLGNNLLLLRFFYYRCWNYRNRNYNRLWRR